MSWPARKCGIFAAPQRTLLRVSHRVSPFKHVYPFRKFSQPSIEKPFVEELRYPPVLGPILFTIGVSGGAIGLGAYWTNRDTQAWTNSLTLSKTWVDMFGAPNNDDLRRARYNQLALTLKKGLDKGKALVGESPNYVSSLALHAYAMCARKWLGATEGRRVCRTIIAVNAAIWLAWQIPRLRPIMQRHFMHYPLSGLSHTLFTCVFSHKNFLHLLFNGMAFTGFGTAAYGYLAMQQTQSPTQLRESTTRYHFLSFFISAGLFSSLLSHVVRARFHFPQLLSKLTSPGTAAAASGTAVASTAVRDTVPQILPSLGASGAIWACVSLSALAFPDARMSLIIPTSFSIPIQTGAMGLVALDVLGIIRGWRFFDHWAHLGGAMFGVIYYAYGPRIWDAARLHTGPPEVSHDP